jgi:hypothetical protein
MINFQIININKIKIKIIQNFLLKKIVEYLLINKIKISKNLAQYNRIKIIKYWIINKFNKIINNFNTLINSNNQLK